MSATKNILFIMADQLRWDYLSCTGHPTLATPNIDRLAARGVLFDRTYVQSPVCGPSRMSFYTGRYVASHRSTWLFVPLPLSERTMGDYLAAAGCDLTLVGKSHFFPDVATIDRLGGSADRDKAALALEGGFEVVVRDDGVFGHGRIETDYANYLRRHGYDSDNPWHDFANSAEGPEGEILSGWHLRYAREPARVPDEHGETAYMTDRAIEFIDRKGDAPWCLHLSYIKPHWPYVVSAPYNTLYGPGDALPVNRHDDERASDHPVYRAFMERDESRAFMRDEVRDTVVPIYMGLIKQLDDHIGRLIDHLEAAGRLDDTLIVFTSDHGDYLGDHWLGEKEMFHDASVRVPLILVDPSAAADGTRGTVDHRLVESIDLAPTFMEALGIAPAGEALEGRSLLPVTRGTQGSDWRDATFSEIDYAFHRDVREALDRPIDLCRGAMVFDGRYKYVHYEGFPPQLFDLEDDPQELIDRGVDGAYADVRARLHERLFRWQRTLKQRTTVDDAFVDRWQAEANAGGVIVGQW